VVEVVLREDAVPGGWIEAKGRLTFVRKKSFVQRQGSAGDIFINSFEHVVKSHPSVP
jgi:hypothetical protein